MRVSVRRSADILVTASVNVAAVINRGSFVVNTGGSVDVQVFAIDCYSRRV